MPPAEYLLVSMYCLPISCLPLPLPNGAAAAYKSVRLSVQRLQLDNMLPATPFPVVLAPALQQPPGAGGQPVLAVTLTSVLGGARGRSYMPLVAVRRASVLVRVRGQQPSGTRWRVGAPAARCLVPSLHTVVQYHQYLTLPRPSLPPWLLGRWPVTLQLAISEALVWSCHQLVLRLQADLEGVAEAGGGATVAASDVPVRIRLLSVDGLRTEISFQGDPLSRPRQVGTCTAGVVWCSVIYSVLSFWEARRRVPGKCTAGVL